MPGGFDPILDDIIKGVENNGSHSIHWEILLNMPFRRETSKPSPEAQLATWAKENNLRYEWAEERRGKKKDVYVVFSKTKSK